MLNPMPSTIWLTEVHLAEARPGWEGSLSAWRRQPLAEGSVCAPNPNLEATSHRESGVTALLPPLPGCGRISRQPQASPPPGYGLCPLPQLWADTGSIGVWGQSYFSTTFSRSVASETRTPQFPRSRDYLVLYHLHNHTELPQQEHRLQATSACVLYDKS